MIGRSLSHFRILAKIGEGGMGVVYRAEDERLRRPVALKILPPDLVADEERRRRLLREARAAAAVTHPNVATVYEAGEADGVVFIAMELVEGRPLRERIGGRPLPLTDALRIATEIAEGLARAHQAQVVHRDLKPDNIIVGADGHVKILDFGLARLLEAGEPGELTGGGSPADRSAGGGTPAGGGASPRPAGSRPSRLDTVSSDRAREGRITGTVAYMSPEQARGEAVDSRSDLFSFGVTLYETVTGKLPFQGRTPMDTLGAILQKEPAAAVEVNPAIPAKLDEIIAKCLEKDPQDRYQRADELLVDLRKLKRATDSGLQAARPPSAQVRRWPLPPVWRLALGLAAVVGLIAWLSLGGLRGRLTGHAAPGPIDSLAVLPFENLSGDPEQAFFAEGMTEELITRLSKIGALRVVSRTSATRYKGARKSVPEIARELNVAGVVEGSVQRAGGRVRVSAQLIDGRTDRHLWAESYERDLRDVLALESDVARAIAQEIRVNLTEQEQARLASARPVNPEAFEAYLKGRYYWNKRTEGGLRKGLEYFQIAIEKDPTYALAYAGLADCYTLLPEYGEVAPQEALPKAKAAALKAIEIDDSLAEAHTSLAVVLEDHDWDWPGAEREFRRAIELNPNYATAHHWLGYFLGFQGRHDEAIAEIKRALELDPLSLIINTALGEQYRMARQYDRAIEQARRTLELDPSFFAAHSLLGRVYALTGRHRESVEESRQGVELSGGSPYAVKALGYAYGAAGMRAEAEGLLADLMRRSDRKYVSPVLIATIRAGMGEKDQALAQLEQASTAHNSEILTVKEDPVFDSLHAEPRFKDLLRRIGLPAD